MTLSFDDLVISEQLNSRVNIPETTQKYVSSELM